MNSRAEVGARVRYSILRHGTRGRSGFLSFATSPVPMWEFDLDYTQRFLAGLISAAPAGLRARPSSGAVAELSAAQIESAFKSLHPLLQKRIAFPLFADGG